MNYFYFEQNILNNLLNKYLKVNFLSNTRLALCTNKKIFEFEQEIVRFEQELDFEIRDEFVEVINKIKSSFKPIVDKNRDFKRYEKYYSFEKK